MSRRPVLSILLAVAALGPAAVSRAQDIEAVAALRGIALPEGYHARVRAQPGFFEFPANGWSLRAASSAAGAQRLAGSLRLLVIPALFADSPEPFVTPAQIRTTLFDGPATRTVTGFYLENSGGRMAVTGHVASWVRTGLTLAQVVGTSFGLGADARTGEYLVQALGLADAVVDFRLFDNDGPDGIPDSGDDDGIVDAVAFEFLEVSASCGGPAIWPHRSSIRGLTGSSYDSQDIGFGGAPVRVNGYIIQSATECDGVSVQASNTIAHELGHVFGLPDLYHPIDGTLPALRRWVVGCWGLMAAGSWGCGDPLERTFGYGPVHMTPWSKHRLGWIEYTPVGEVVDASIPLEPSQISERALRIRLAPETDEVAIIEYRPRLGFDADLPASGVLIYRENPSAPLRPTRASGSPYHIHILEADGRTDLLRTHAEGGNRGEASDAFATGVGPTRLSNITTPGLRLTSGAPSTVTIHEIAVEGARARIRLTTRPTPTVRGAPAPALGRALDRYEHRYRILGGALPYRIELRSGSLPVGLELVVDGEELRAAGTLLQSGEFHVSIHIIDARGSEATLPFALRVEDVFIEPARVAEFLLGGRTSPLTESEIRYVDVGGNGNGQLDVGDVRAHVLRNR